MEVILREAEIARILDELAEAICRDCKNGMAVALVGIRSRGEILAQRLQKLLEAKCFRQVERGTLDITLYRDDLNRPGSPRHAVRATEIDFGIDDKLIVLVDDVLNTGRSVRGALDALFDLGRPKAIRLAVLIDRGQRELPISGDYIGRKISAPPEKRVSVYLRERDNREEVVIE